MNPINTLNYIDGTWVPSGSGSLMESIDPATGEVIGYAQNSTLQDLEQAVDAARNAFDRGGWAFAPAVVRARVLTTLAARMNENREHLARLITLQNGRPIKTTRGEVDRCVEQAEYFAAQARTLSGRINQTRSDIASLIIREPIGVCGLITPWNFPLDLAMRKMAPALAVGCTIVLKPSPLTSIVTMELMKLFDGIDGLPNGVVNCVSGSGSLLGEALVTSPKVDKISFTGSTETARRILRAGADTMKRISLEAGGKSPNIVFDDAPMDAAVNAALWGVFASSGQSCTAKTRLLVQRSIQDAFVSELTARTRRIRVGPGMDETVDIGPIASEMQLNTVMDFIRSGVEEGAEKVIGGERMLEKPLERGFFVEPAIFANVSNQMRIGRDEIFGPVLSVMPFDDEDEAIALANDSNFGLSSAIFTNNIKRAFQVAQRLQSGEVVVNSHKIRIAEAPFGGYKQSGLGRELGAEGLDHYQQIKHIAIDLS